MHVYLIYYFRLQTNQLQSDDTFMTPHHIETRSWQNAPFIPNNHEQETLSPRADYVGYSELIRPNNPAFVDELPQILRIEPTCDNIPVFLGNDDGQTAGTNTEKLFFLRDNVHYSKIIKPCVNYSI